MNDLERQNAELRDRNTTLEHVLRLQLEIGKHLTEAARLHAEVTRSYAKIVEQHSAVDGLHREIEMLLQGSSPVPNN